MSPRLLGELLAEAGLPRLEPGDADPLVVDVTHDSREVQPGWLFCALPGAVSDGHAHAHEAVAAGAVALVVERPLPLPVPQVQVPDARVAMAPLAAAVHGHPSDRLTVVAVTGTNGKTTTAHLMASIWVAAGVPAAVVGTLTGRRTTPEASDLQRQLARFESDGVRAVALEATSIGLAAHRLDAVAVDVAVFTNLSRDHLDVHGTMERYFAAKALLFEKQRSRVAVVNLDDVYGRLLLDGADIPTLGYSLADAGDLRVGRDSSTFTWRSHPVRLGMGGRFNVANALAAAHAAAQLGIADDLIAAGLSAAPTVPGRYEAVDAGQDFTVLVDYAHTPDGLEQLLVAAREAAAGHRVIVAFGCGGDRDQTKRPDMGAVAAALADVAVVTSDNPRREDPGAIIAAVLSGIGAGTRAEVIVEPDRRAAIEQAVGLARTGDVVVVAGKGHETTQELAEATVTFDDRAEVRRALAERHGGRR